MSEDETAKTEPAPSEEEEVPNQHAVSFDPIRAAMKTERTIGVSVEDLMSLGVEVKQLREQVFLLQATGSAQLQAARASAFEMAAQVCDRIYEEQWRWLSGDDSADPTEFAREIRELAKR